MKHAVIDIGAEALCETRTAQNARFKAARWSTCRTKRMFDLVVACLALALCAPAMLVVALLIKVSSRGPVLFRQIRVGRGGKKFEILKFRTMTQSHGGLYVTRHGDSRVTRVGRFLRKWKLDELPQLVNVLRNDMSLVGPRPDVAKYLLSLTPAQQAVLQLRPGMTSMASLRFRNEEEILAKVEKQKVETYYVSVILAAKIQIDLEYAERATFLRDVECILRTVIAVLR